MKAIQLTGYKGFESMQLFEVEKPKPAANEVLLEVKAAGVNFAELELTKGRYRIPKEPPFIMGFEAAGVVVELGARVKNLKVGDRITSLVSTGGYAEFATADATVAIPIPEGISFNEAATIPVQGLSAYALLKLAAKPQASETLLVQSAAGGVGLYLVQLAKIVGVRRLIALASSKEKLDLLTGLGVQLVFAGTNVIQSNTIVDSSTAVYGCNNSVSGNTVTGNTIADAGVGVSLPAGNTFHPNVFSVVGTAVITCVN